MPARWLTDLCLQRLIQIRQYVLDRLDPHRQPDHLRFDPGLGLLGFAKLAVGGRGGVAGQRLGIADVDQPLEDLERIVEAYPASYPSFRPKERMAEGRPPMYFSASG